MHYSLNNIDINIDVNEGIYNLGFNGATGKTYLYKLLVGCMSIGSNGVLALTYDVTRNVKEMLRIVNNFNGDLILLDRFDLYFDAAILDVCMKQSKVTLIDLKSNKLLNQTYARIAHMSMKEDSIEVKAW